MVSADIYKDIYNEFWSEVKHLIFCIEEYNKAEHLSDKEVSDLFEKYYVFDFITSCFEALHTTGTNYIIEDIDLYIEARLAV